MIDTLTFITAMFFMLAMLWPFFIGAAIYGIWLVVKLIFNTIISLVLFQETNILNNLAVGVYDYINTFDKYFDCLWTFARYDHPVIALIIAIITLTLYKEMDV